MRYIIGLGNPGKEFNLTRHNVGHLALDKIKEAFNFPDFKTNKKINSDLSRGEIEGIEAILAKSRLFMNESGKTVQILLNFYKGTPGDVFIIHDDIDLNLGKIKISRDSGSAGHNGVQDIINRIGTKKIVRIRIGVANEKLRSHIDPADFVLQKFQKIELGALKEAYSHILHLLPGLLKNKS